MPPLPAVLIVILVTLGPSLAIGWVGYASIKALGRNPAYGPKIQLLMLVAFIFVEAIAIVALLVLFHMVTRS